MRRNEIRDRRWTDTGCQVDAYGEIGGRLRGDRWTPTGR